MADIEVTITIPDEHVPRVVATFNALCGAEVTMHSTNATTGIPGNSHISIAEKGESETNLQMGKRIIKRLILGAVELSEKGAEDNRYQSEIAAVTPPTVEVSDDIIT